jgi:glycosyltransferase involved in cell wall biosynthesis
MMAIWLPYTAADSGSSIFMQRLGAELNRKGLTAHVQEFPHNYQYAPFLLSSSKPPPGATTVITNSWSGFAFHRSGLRSICVEHLFVLDDALTPYKSGTQRIFHERILSSYLARSYKSADHIVAVSDYTARAIRRRFPNIRVSCIPNGVDTGFFMPSSEPASSSGRRFRVGFAGNQSRRKGTDLLVPIMESLGDRFELWHTGPEMPNVPPSLHGRFHPQGKLAPDRMRDFYRQCDVLVAPTRLEGLPLTVIEAQACGVPVVTTDCTSLPEVVSNEETGFICPVDDVLLMAERCRMLAKDTTLLERMGKAARARALERFQFEKMVGAYVALFDI